MQQKKPKKSYIICATPRSGSHLLCESLKNTNLAGKPDEYFITDQENGLLQNEVGHVAEEFGKKTLREFQDFVIDVGSTPNGSFGISILWGDFNNIVENYQRLPEYTNLNAYEIFDDLFNNPKYIWLTRQDKVRQAVSLEKAIQTDVWRKSTHEKFQEKWEAKFDFERIQFRRKKLEEGDLAWQGFFEKQQITPFKVIYEELVHDYEQTAIDILNFLDIPYPETIEFGERRLQKQADELSEKWVTQYHKIERAKLSLITTSWSKLRRYVRSISIK